VDSQYYVEKSKKGTIEFVGYKWVDEVTIDTRKCAATGTKVKEVAAVSAVSAVSATGKQKRARIRPFQVDEFGESADI